jgi:hypothetical protein
MPTSLTRSSISVIPDDGKPTEDQFTFHKRRFKNRLHGEVLRRYLDEKQASKLSKSELARRMGKDPAQITRWLSAPKNMEIETISDLLLAMGYIPQVTSVKLTDLYRSNHFETMDVLEKDAPAKDVAVTGAGSSRSNARFEKPVQVSAQ